MSLSVLIPLMPLLTGFGFAAGTAGESRSNTIAVGSAGAWVGLFGGAIVLLALIK